MGDGGRCIARIVRGGSQVDVARFRIISGTLPSAGPVYPPIARSQPRPVNRRSRVIALLALIVASCAIALVALALRPAPPTLPDGPTPAISMPAIPAGIVLDTIGTTTVVAHDPAAHPAPLAEPTQRRVWWAGGRWWAILPDPVTLGWQMLAASGPDGPWSVRGLVDDRRRIALDVAIRGEELLVIAAGTGGERDRLLARRFQLVNGAYVLVADSPIQAVPAGVRHLSIAYGPDGAAWIAYVAGGRLHVMEGPNGGASWGRPRALEGASETLEPTHVALVGTGAGVVLAWTATGADRLWLQRRDADGWTETSVEVGGTVTTSLSVARVPGSTDVLALVGIGTAGGGQAPSAVLVRAPVTGRATVNLVARNADRLRAPVVAVAPDAAAAVVFGTIRSASGADTVVVKAAPLDTLAFPSGPGVRVMGGGVGASVRAPLVPALASPDDEIVVVGVREQPSDLRSSTVLVGGGAPPDAPEPLPVTVVEGLVRQGFDASPPGSTPSSWVRPAGADAGTFEVDGPAENRYARLVSTNRRTARACLDFRGVTDGELVARMSLRVNRPGTADTWVALRGRGDAAVILFDDDRSIAYRSGDTKVSTGERYALRRWYRWEVSVDVAAGRYGWTLSRGGSVVTRADGIPWRMTDPAAPIDTICLEVPAGRRGPSLDMDDLVVDHVPVPTP